MSVLHHSWSLSTVQYVLSLKHRHSNSGENYMWWKLLFGKAAFKQRKAKQGNTIFYHLIIGLYFLTYFNSTHTPPPPQKKHKKTHTHTQKHHHHQQLSNQMIKTGDMVVLRELVNMLKFVHNCNNLNSIHFPYYFEVKCEITVYWTVNILACLFVLYCLLLF